MFPAKLRLTYLFILCGLFLTLCGCQSQEPSSASGSTPAITVVASAASSNLHAEQTDVSSVTGTPSPTSSPTPTPSPSPTPIPTPSPSPTPVVTGLTFSFTGDVTLGSDLINQNAIRNFYRVYETVQDDSYFFANVLPYLSSDDMTLVNLECVLSERGTRQDKTFAFRGDPSYVNILTLGSVEAVSLANNHSFDYGQESHDDTRSTLTDAGILFSYQDIVSYTTIKDIKVAMISIYYYLVGLEGAKDLLDQTIAEAEAENASLILTSFHWGTEGTPELTKEQTELAHYAVDHGADIVLGHHPHVLQPIEKYNDRYIVYSLGNFCFGGNTNPKDKDTMIFRQNFTFVDGTLIPDDTVEVIPCSVSSVTEKNNYQPTPQTGQEAKRIIEKLNSYCLPYGVYFIEKTDGIYIPGVPELSEVPE